MRDHQSPQTLIIRFWEERSSDKKMRVLRGSIENVQQGQRIHFRSQEDLIAKLSLFLEWEPPTASQIRPTKGVQYETEK